MQCSVMRRGVVPDDSLEYPNGEYVIQIHPECTTLAACPLYSVPSMENKINYAKTCQIDLEHLEGMRYIKHTMIK